MPLSVSSVEGGIQADPWLAAVCGRDVFRIEVSRQSSDEEMDVVRDHARRRARAFYYARVDTDRVDVVRRLGQLGFSIVDTAITFGMDAATYAAASHEPTRPVCAIEEVRPDEEEAVLGIAGSCFRWSRFHLDPDMPEELANRIKTAWVRSYLLRERGDRLFGAVIGDRMVGFLAALTKTLAGRQVGIIDLIGVEDAVQGRGIGTALVRQFLAQYQTRCSGFQVGTQAANLPSIRLYERCGFSVT